MSAQVVTIDGLPLASPGDPDEEVVAQLEALLERARNGEVVAVSIVHSNADGSTGWVQFGTSLNTLAMIGELERLKARMLASLEE